MPKRAERRHHLERVKDKWKRVVKRWMKNWEPRPIRWLRGGELIEGRTQEYIEHNANLMEGRHVCHCGICRGYKEAVKADKRPLNRGWKPTNEDME